MSKQTPTLHEVMQKCSKSELIDVILRAQRLTYITFPWINLISEIKLNSIEASIDANLAELNKLNEKIRAIPEERRVISDDEYRNIMIAICDNNKEYSKLQKRHDKLFKEIYG